MSPPFSLSTCPRCGCVDLSQSRTRGFLEQLLRAAGVGPRRCSACGWRGFRPDYLVARQRRSSPPKGGQGELTPAMLERQRKEHRMHRQYRRNLHARTKKWRRAQIVLAALVLGVAIGAAAGSCGG